MQRGGRTISSNQPSLSAVVCCRAGMGWSAVRQPPRNATRALFGVAEHSSCSRCSLTHLQLGVRQREGQAAALAQLRQTLLPPGLVHLPLQE